MGYPACGELPVSRCVIGAVSKNVGRSVPGQSGAVMLEFVIAFPLVLVLMFACIQFSEIWIARMVVHYGAFCAARSALVCKDTEYGSPGGNPALPPGRHPGVRLAPPENGNCRDGPLPSRLAKIPLGTSLQPTPTILAHHAHCGPDHCLGHESVGTKRTLANDRKRQRPH